MVELKKMTKQRQNIISSRMRQLMGYRFFKFNSEIFKFEIAHSNLNIMEVIAGHTSISVEERKKLKILEKNKKNEKEIEKENNKKPKKRRIKEKVNKTKK